MLCLDASVRKFLIKEGAQNRAPSFFASSLRLHPGMLLLSAMLKIPPALPLFRPPLGGKDFTKDHTYNYNRRYAPGNLELGGKPLVTLEPITHRRKNMGVSPLAGKPAPQSILVKIPRLVSAYYTNHPDPSDISQLVEFGTSGHRGTSVKNTFNEDHILAITQAICEFRKAKGITGPLFLGKDTHALSEPSFASAIEVLAANGVDILVQSDWGYTPTPVISHAILAHNRKKESVADGIIITPSHNPPEDRGFQVQPARRRARPTRR